MRPEEWERCVEIFSAALRRQSEQRAAFIDHACAGDESLRREVMLLLCSHEESGDFISAPVFVSAPELLTDDDPDALVGTQIGPYRIESVLGRGGMGVVYVALDERLGRKVGLKLLPQSLAADMTHLGRLKREARTASALNHPNIVTIHEIGEADSTSYIASELIDGETLRQRLARGPIALNEAIDIATQVASALAAAHNAGIVHRDIKPENIMLRPDGYVKVLDFGIAKLTESAFAEATADGAGSMTPADTNLGSILGTVRYMSPEQACPAVGGIDKRTDIWSLGVVLYEMLTGHAPFTGNTPQDIMSSILEKEPPPLTSYVAHIPAELQQIISKTLRKDCEERYRSAHDLLQALKGLRHKLEVEAELERTTAAASWQRWTRSPTALALVLLVAALALALPFYWHRNPTTASPPEKSIAVLPFENLSEEKANVYFAEGIENEILTKLATVRDLKVISRTSTAKYQSKPDNLRTVAQELGVSTILEGAVQKAGDKVRVNVQLIDARNDTHLWGKSYDRDFKDVLGVESEVSQEIAEALQANLSPSESHGLASARTPDTKAYDLFLRAEYELHQAENSFAAEAYDRADAFYRQALARDPNFAEATAELARSRLSRHWNVSPLAPAELEEVKSLIDRGLALAPNSPEAHFALGLFFYWGHRQYKNALTEFNRTLELQSNNALARQYCAYVYRRCGEWERSLADFQRAEELDPRDAEIPTNIGATYLALRQWKDAEPAELRALAIDPQKTLAAILLLTTRLNGTGNIDSAWRALNGFPQGITLIDSVAERGDVAHIINARVYLDVIERRFTDAFQALEKEVADSDRGRLQQLAELVAVRVLAGQTEAAKSAGEEALPLLEARLRERPDDISAMTELSWVYLALGRNTDALRLSRQAADTLSIEKDALTGPSSQNGLAQIEARAGAPEEAIKRLRRLLSIPAGQVASIARLKIDPVWDPIRNRPDFQQLLSGPEQIGPNK
jgi:eukaryotic-like serine/threonine-protein kinase